MTAIVWNQVGQRRFETGVDRGVLFRSFDWGIPWNGLTSVEESSDVEVKPFYMSGVKFLEAQVPGDFAAKLSAYTYPDEFEECIGTFKEYGRLSISQQRLRRFHLCYRTLIGNDVESVEHGSRINIIYNALAKPEPRQFQTIGDQPDPSEFSWAITTVPVLHGGGAPTSHISFDSTDLSEGMFEYLEQILYGSDDYGPMLFSIDQFRTFVITESPPQVLRPPSVEHRVPNPWVGDILTCAPGVWSGAPFTLEYQWYLGGSPLLGENNKTYTITESDVGYLLSCEVIATNPAGTNSQLSSNTTIVVEGG